MANEFSMSFQVSLTNGTLKDQYSSGTLAANQSTAALVRNVQSIVHTPSHTALDLGSVSSCGYAVFVNLDASNYIEIGTDVTGTFAPFAKVDAGKAIMLKLATNAPYALANTATVKLFYIIYAA